MCSIVKFLEVLLVINVHALWFLEVLLIINVHALWFLEVLLVINDHALWFLEVLLVINVHALWFLEVLLVINVHCLWFLDWAVVQEEPKVVGSVPVLWDQRYTCIYNHWTDRDREQRGHAESRSNQRRGERYLNNNEISEIVQWLLCGISYTILYTLKLNLHTKWMTCNNIQHKIVSDLKKIKFESFF